MLFEKLTQDFVKELITEVPELDITPTKGWVICYDLPQTETTQSGLVIAETTNQHFTFGFVLKIYEPYEKHLRTLREDGVTSEKSLLVSCPFTQGDIVIYPHYAGRHLLPSHPHIRFVEVEGGLNNSGCIVGKMDAQDVTVKESLEKIFAEECTPEYSSILTQKLLDKFVILDKESGSTSLIGS